MENLKKRNNQYYANCEINYHREVKKIYGVDK